MTSHKVSKRLTSFLVFLLASVLSGLLISGLTAPFAILASQSANLVAKGLDDLPAEFNEPPQMQQSIVYMADGSELVRFYEENRIYKKLNQIAPIMLKAQVAIEDHNFYEHGAIDGKGVVRALVSTLLKGEKQGGSTISQQYVKMVALESAVMSGDKEAQAAAVEPTYARKIRELRYALALEKKVNKNDILERYLNIAYYGAGAYGVEAAARRYFSTTADKLTLDQAAMLAGLVKSPDSFEPIKNPTDAIKRRNHVLNRMAELKIITQKESTTAKAKPFDRSKISSQPQGCRMAQFGFLCDYIYRNLVKNATSLGKTPEERANKIKRGGLIIKTMLDPKVQKKTEEIINSQVSPLDPVIATMTLLQPKTGGIIAMAQSRPDKGIDVKKGQTEWNDNVEMSMGGREGFQAGSTFKAFTLMAAVEKGIPLNHRIVSNPYDLYGEKIQTCDRGVIKYRQHQIIKGGNKGLVDMATATAWSYNPFFTKLSQEAGLCNVVKMTERLGVRWAQPLPNPNDKTKLLTMEDYFQTKLNFTLGVMETTPLSMAEAYATIANRGVHCKPNIVQAITDSKGKKYQLPPNECKQVVDPKVADGVAQLLRGPIERGTGTAARLPGPWDQAGKTGTTTSNGAVWFVGFTPEVAGASMLAVDKIHPFFKGKDISQYDLSHVTLASGNRLYNPHAQANTIWKQSMLLALQGRPDTKFVLPTQEIVEGKKIPLPSVSGMSADQAKVVLSSAGFYPSILMVDSNTPAGTFLGITPSKAAPPGSRILIKISRGPAPIPPPAPAAPAPAPAPAPPAPAPAPAPAPGPGR